MTKEMIKLTKAQKRIYDKLLAGGAIGEFQNGKTASFEVFFPNHKKERWELSTILPATFYALLTLGAIEKDNTIGNKMGTYGRDNWYTIKE